VDLYECSSLDIVLNQQSAAFYEAVSLLGGLLNLKGMLLQYVWYKHFYSSAMLCVVTALSGFLLFNLIIFIIMMSKIDC